MVLREAGGGSIEGATIGGATMEGTKSERLPPEKVRDNFIPLKLETFHAWGEQREPTTTTTTTPGTLERGERPYLEKPKTLKAHLKTKVQRAFADMDDLD